MNDQPILSMKSLPEYFKDLLSEAAANQRVPLGPVTEYYLVDLLARFTDANTLYARAPDGSREEEPLAFILRRAIEGEPDERVQALRRLGEHSLFVAGFFGDSLSRRRVHLDYFISMGGGAYGALASMARGRPAGGAFGGVYEELRDNFSSIVDLFSEISERVSVTTNQGLIRLYERWVRTGSERLSRLLAEQGVIPARFGPGGLQ